MREIVADRVVLRNFAETDYPSFVELVDDYRRSAYSKYDHKWPDAAEEKLDMLRWFSGSDEFLAVTLKSSGALIGLVSLNKECEEDRVTYNLGYVFNSLYHGAGYAYEACSAYIEYAHDELKARVFVTGTARENRKSCRLLEKLGFAEQGESERHFQEDQDGRPFVFTGVMYTMERENS